MSGRWPCWIGGWKTLRRGRRPELIRASLTGDKFATDKIVARAFEAHLSGLFFAFMMADPVARVLAYAYGSEAQAVALLDNLINGLVRKRAQAAA